MKAPTLGLLAVGLLAGSAAAHSAGVVIDGREWRQLTETTNLTWYQVADVCNSSTGACNGSIGEVNFAGWTWASITDVQALFDALIYPGSIQFPNPTSDFEEYMSPEIDRAIGAPFFLSTANVGYYGEDDFIWGWSRTVSTSEFAVWTPWMVDHGPWCIGATNPARECIDHARLSGQDYKFNSDTKLGVWLFRTVSVSEPGTLALLGLGLVGLGLSRRRKAN